jgi:hypothetical protein
MPDTVDIDAERLSGAMSAWRAGVPKAVAYSLPTEAGDGASSTVLAALADWPVQHELMSTHRETAATDLHAATQGTRELLTAAEDENVALITREGQL